MNKFNDREDRIEFMGTVLLIMHSAQVSVLGVVKTQFGMTSLYESSCVVKSVHKKDTLKYLKLR